ncbi:MAG TPA: thioesterase domain-containing protein, partial [Thermoanaerobaculia bacterium]|nr:thioesterase domain-containing protein [Thermoanaerobaculia bacterium]
PLARHLGPEQPLYGLQARGLAGDGEPLRSVEEMAELYIDELLQVQPEGPYQIAGWSLGGLVAFEMARQLREQGMSVALLVILDGTAGMAGVTVEDDLDVLGDVITYNESFWRKDLGVTRDQLAALAPAARLEHLLERLRAIDFFPPGAGAEHLARILAVYRANTEAAGAYEPGIYADRITVLRAGGAPGGPGDGPLGLLGEPDLGWSRVSTEPVEVRTTPGTHFTMLTEPNVQELARQLALLLARNSLG